MTRAFTWTVRLAVVAVVMAALGVGYLFAAYPQIPPAEHVSIERTPGTLARGQYLFDHVAGCADCHSTRDWTKYAGPIVPGTIGKGGELFGKNLGLPGDFYAPNITPAGVGEWTDGELVRAITAGVSRHGEPLFPIMPYPVFGRMAKDDVEAIVAYMRTLPPIANSVPERTFTFPMQFVVRTLPKPPSFTTRPDGRDRVRLGEYLAAGCTDCHSPAKQGTPIPGMAFAGGTEFPLPDGGYVRAANLTPDVRTGLGGWTEEAFVTRFKAMAERPDVTLKSAAQRRRNTVMPWKLLGGMTNEDLGAIFAYLRTLPPVENQVQKHVWHAEPAPRTQARSATESALDADGTSAPIASSLNPREADLVRLASPRVEDDSTPPSLTPPDAGGNQVPTVRDELPASPEDDCATPLIAPESQLGPDHRDRSTGPAAPHARRRAERHRRTGRGQLRLGATRCHGGSLEPRAHRGQARRRE